MVMPQPGLSRRQFEAISHLLNGTYGWRRLSWTAELGLKLLIHQVETGEQDQGLNLGRV